jgi:hypothetical protein
VNRGKPDNKPTIWGWFILPQQLLKNGDCGCGLPQRFFVDPFRQDGKEVSG